MGFGCFVSVFFTNLVGFCKISTVILHLGKCNLIKSVQKVQTVVTGEQYDRVK